MFYIFLQCIIQTPNDLIIAPEYLASSSIYGYIVTKCKFEFKKASLACISCVRGEINAAIALKSHDDKSD